MHGRDISVDNADLSSKFLFMSGDSGLSQWFSEW